MAEPGLSPLLSSLETTAKALNEASDALNSKLNTIEKQLSALNLGVEVWLPKALTQSDKEGSTFSQKVWTEQWLGYAKVNGKWCFAVKRMRLMSGFYENNLDMPYQDEYLDEGLIALAQASREARLAALLRLPELLENVDAAAKDTLSRATQLLP